MSYSATLTATPDTVNVGETIVFSGRAIDENGLGLPFWDLDIQYVGSGEVMVGLVPTDGDGYYSVEWVPTEDYVGIFQVVTEIPHLQGFFSPPVTITVLTPGTEPPPVPVTIDWSKILFWGLLIAIPLVVISRRK